MIMIQSTVESVEKFAALNILSLFGFPLSYEITIEPERSLV